MVGYIQLSDLLCQLKPDKLEPNDAGWFRNYLNASRINLKISTIPEYVDTLIGISKCSRSCRWRKRDFRCNNNSQHFRDSALVVLWNNRRRTHCIFLCSYSRCFREPQRWPLCRALSVSKELRKDPRNLSFRIGRNLSPFDTGRRLLKDL